MVIDAPGNITTSKGSSGKYQNHDFISGLEGIGDLKMSWIDRDVSKGNKETFGKELIATLTEDQKVASFFQALSLELDGKRSVKLLAHF